MVTQITLGNLFTQNGKTVLGGGQAGIDTENLIKGLAEIKRLPAVKLEDKVKLNETRLTAFNDLKSILGRFKDASNFLRNPPGVQNADQNIFQYRTGTVSSDNAIAGSNYLTATVKSGTEVQNYTINEIEQLAQAAKQESNGFTIANLDTAVVSTPALAGRFAAGTVTVNGQNITLSDGDTLRSVVTKFNAVKDQTGIAASTLQVAPGEFKVIFTATRTGESADFDLESAGTVSSDPSGVLANLTFTTTQIARNAKFTLDNVEIERESNSFDDLIDGVTFTLKQPTSGNALRLAIEPDRELVKTGVTNFVNAYNEFRLFYARQTAKEEDGSPADGAALGGNPTLRTVLDRVSAELSRTVSGLSDANKLSDFGITSSDYAGDDETPFTRNTLTYDDAKLTSALSADFDGVRKAFEFTLQSNNPRLQVFSRDNRYAATDFSISLNQNTGTYSATYDVSGAPVTVAFGVTSLGGGAVTLRGPAGSKLEGLALIYSGSGTDIASVDVSTSQGFGDRLYNVLDEVLKDSSGSLAREITGIGDENKRHEKDITRIDDQISRYRDSLIRKYATLEAALSKVNSILQSLDAQAQAQNNA